jgi:hypothetical protein
MPPASDLPDLARDVLVTARHDRRAAAAAVGALSLDEQVALVCRTPAARRAELLDLAPHPEALIPALPEAELVFAVKAVGRGDSAWILAHATDDQLRSCIDLDAWRDFAPSPDAVGEWIAALAEADDDTLLRGMAALDPELVMLWMRDRVEIHQKAGDDPGWQPPAGGQTIDGVHYVVSLRANEDVELMLRWLSLLLESDPPAYFRVLQAVIWEDGADNEEHALRWRTGRLADLGFPNWEEAAAIYARPRREEIEKLPADAPATSEWHLPIFMPELPALSDATLSVFRAAATLDDDARRRFAYAFLALANHVAVADRLPLGDADSIPKAVDKAARVASRGLDHLAARHATSASDVLRRVPLVRLFRVGAHLDRAETAP